MDVSGQIRFVETAEKCEKEGWDIWLWEEWSGEIGFSTMMCADVSPLLTSYTAFF